MRRLLLAALVTIFIPAALAQMKDMPMKMGDGKAGATHKGTGTVKSVDAKQGTVNLAHDPIQSMNWPAMSMTFKAQDKAMLEKVKPGAKVEFSFVQSGKDYVVTDIK
jgi:Cu(I)/Ag(I) efflux system periplasmic protein CusF